MKTTHPPIFFMAAWLFIIALPSLLMIFIKVSSFSLGISIASVILLVAFSVTSLLTVEHPHARIKVQSLISVFVLLLFIVLHFYFVNVRQFNFVATDIKRFCLSYTTFTLVLISALLVSGYLRNLSEVSFHGACRFISVILLFNAIVSLSGVDFFSTGLSKPTFIYLEPSHFALVVAPFISYFCLISTKVKASLLLFFAAFWAAYIQNLTMLIAVLLAFVLSTRRNLVVSIFALSAVIFLLMIFVGVDRLSYFNDRLSFSSNSDNLSVLVLYQGWENALNTLIEISWFGAGFQQFGVATYTGAASGKLYELLGFDINQYDGGTTASKIVGEFGVFGLLLLIFYLLSLFIAVKRIRSRKIDSKKTLFALVVFVSSILEIFVRGVGYFSPSLFTLIVSVLYLSIFENSNKLKVGSGKL